MNRTTKNIIMSFVLVIVITITGFTIYNAKKSVEVDTSNTKTINNSTNKNGSSRPNNSEKKQNIGGNSSNEENSDNSSKSNKRSKTNSTNSTEETNQELNNTEMPPEPPSGQMPEMGEGNTPPEMPNGEMPNMGSGEMPPEPPSGEMGEMGEGNTPPEMPNGEMPNMGSGEMANQGVEQVVKKGSKKTTEENTKLAPKYYVFFCIEGLTISIIASYLVVSKGNKYTLKEVFTDKKKIAIYALSTVLLTGAIAATTIIVSNNFSNNVETTENTNSSTSNSDKRGNSKNSNQTGNTSYSAKEEITESKSITSGEYTSTTADENALSINGDVEVDLSNIKVNKEGDSDGGDNTSFYGTNSAIIAREGATLNIKNATITTNATGANGTFSYGGSATTNNSKSDGTTINISDSTITTTKGNSGGIMTTGGGTTNAKNLTITTSGQSSAPIRSDRGGGTVNVDGGTYTSNGVGSPTIYSTADITVKNAKLVSTTSEGIIIEGKNSVTIENVDLTDTHTKNVKSKTYKNIFIYQSMSGDAAEGEATFTAKDSTITTNKGDSIYVSNTTAVINLTNNKFINNDKDGYFLRAQADSWGKEGSNGGIVTLNMTNQTVNGNIAIDSISTLAMTLKSNSSYTGTINGENTANNITITLDKNSSITLTGDSYITELNNADNSNSNINFNGYKLYVNGKAIN